MNDDEPTGDAYVTPSLEKETSYAADAALAFGVALIVVAIAALPFVLASFG